MLQELSIVVNEQSWIWTLQNAKCYLTDNSGLKLRSGLKLTSELETKIVDFEIDFQICQRGEGASPESNSVGGNGRVSRPCSTPTRRGACVARQEILFKGGKYLSKQSLSLATTVAILTKIRDLLYLRHFANSDFVFDLEKIEIVDKYVVLWSNIQINNIPNSWENSIESVTSEIN